MTDDGTIKKFVEGYDRSGKPLERIKYEQLQEHQKEMKKYEVELNASLQKGQLEMLELQNQLKECNDAYALEKQKLDDLRSEQMVTLDGDQKSRIMGVTRETVERFVRKRPQSKDEQMTVDVHFLSGAEMTGFNLHIHGEGAGSRDAKFLVRLNEKVKNLATQAAKYWGLDPDKVFFLDRDGRIVLDNMNLVDIILPPVTGSSSSSSAAPAASGMAGNTGTVAVIEEGEEAPKEKDLWMVRGRNYCLTLVRASTVLSKQDLNRANGEKWEDFTFNEAGLERELENTRKKRGGEEGEGGKINMDAIPSLNDLMQQGQDKKWRKRADTRCRCVEVWVFVLCQVLFILSLLSTRRSGVGSLTTLKGTEDLFTQFVEGDNASSFDHATPSFFTIKTEEQYRQWLSGPMKRVLLMEENMSTLRRGEFTTQLVPLTTFTTRFEAQVDVDSMSRRMWERLGTVTYCGEGNADGVGNDTNGSNSSNVSTEVSTVTSVTATSTATSSTVTTVTFTSTSLTTATLTSTTTVSSTVTGATLTTRTATVYTSTSTTTTSSTTGTNLTAVNISTVPKGGTSCIPQRYTNCRNPRVMELLSKGSDAGHQVPDCSPQYSIFDIQAALTSLSDAEAWPYFEGEVSSYMGGSVRTILRVHNETELDYDLGNFTQSQLISGEFRFIGSAHSISTFVYSPSLNSLMVVHFVIERTLSGGLISSLGNDLVSLNLEEVENHVLLNLSGCLAVLVVLMEIRRILHCPKALTFEEKRTRCSLWTLIFLLLPAMVFAINGMLFSQDALCLATLEAATTNDLDDKAVWDVLWLLSKVQSSTIIMKMLTLLVFNLLTGKFVLLHFPNITSLSWIARKIVFPLLTVFFLGVLGIFGIGVFMYVLYGNQLRSFGGASRSWISMFLFAMGRIRDWEAYYKSQGLLWTMSMLALILIVQLTVNIMPAVIMLSHKREADLFENYSYHPFWDEKQSRGNWDQKTFNPAAVGWDYSGKEPRKVLHDD